MPSMTSQFNVPIEIVLSVKFAMTSPIVEGNLQKENEF
jgi:hypothetical protein